METYATEGNVLLLGFNPVDGDVLEITAAEDAMTRYPIDGSELIFEANLEVAQVLNNAAIALLMVLIGNYQLSRTHGDERAELLQNLVFWGKEADRQLKMANVAVTLKQGGQQTLPPIGMRKQGFSDYR